MIPQSCVAAFLDVVIGGRAVETPPMSTMNLLEGLNRTVVYMTHNQLLTLVRRRPADTQCSHYVARTFCQCYNVVRMFRVCWEGI